MAPNQSLSDKLAMLWELQKLDNEIMEFEDERDKIPRQTGDMDVTLIEKRDLLADKQKQAKQVETDLSEQQRLLDLERIKLKNTRNKETAIQNIQQYEAYVKEIETQEDSGEKIEGQIKSLTERKQTLATDSETLTTEIAELEEKIAAKRQELEARSVELDRALDEMFIRRDGFVEELDKSLYRRYEFIAERVPGGVAISRVIEGHCSACNMQVMPQVANEIMAGKTLHTCQLCNRILVYVEDEE